MSETRDTNLERFFDRADQDLAGAAFVAEVMNEADRQRRGRNAALWAAGLVGLLAVGLMASQFAAVVSMFISLVARPIAADDGGAVATFLAPVNSLAGVLGLICVGLWVAYQKVRS
jgi:threonine dehydrogenase-like Zn-dependent dehydrogenase